MISRRHLLRVLEREREAHAQERARLLAVICELAGKPQAAPVQLRAVPTLREPKPDDGFIDV